ncbi:MAG: cyanophycinase [Candidatus Sumerlaeia bacterium]|nr:cyanophycinase [Candidatus Sumerlaeia bacterium]
MKYLTVTCLLLSAALSTGCKIRPYSPAGEAPSPNGKGSLVIAGGSVRPTNEGLYRAVLDKIPEGGTVVILPTASGVPEQSGPQAVEDFSQYTTAQNVELVEITHTTPERANEPEYIDRIAAARGVYFTGGDQSRILAAFRPDEGDTLGMTTLQTLLREGGVIGGTSAGAAMMSDPMIRWGTSPEALLIGESDAPDRGVGITRGMGFFPYGLVDQHFWERGRIGRLTVAMRDRDIQWGWGINENRALEANLETGMLRPVGGHQGIIVVDRRQVENPGRSHRNIRISLLGDGDEMNAETGSITLAGDRIPFNGLENLDLELDGSIWERGRFKNFLQNFVASNVSSIDIEEQGFLLRFSRDNMTLVAGTNHDDIATLSAVNIRWDIIELDDAEEKAAAILSEITAEND